MDGIETLFWYVIMPLFGFVCLITLPWLIPVIWKFMIPKPARTLFWCARRKQIPVLIVHDSGRGDIVKVYEKRGSGLVMTDQGKYKILPRWIEKPSLEDKAPTTVSTPEENFDQALTETQQPQPDSPADDRKKSEWDKFKAKYLLDISSWVVKRTWLVGLNVPFFVGYTGKICLMNPEALAMYEAGEMKIQTEDETLFKNVNDKKIEDAVQPLMLMDARRIKEIIAKGYDETQIAALVADAEQMGRMGTGFGKWMPLIAIIVIAMVVILAILFLPQLLQGFNVGGMIQKAPATYG